MDVSFTARLTAIGALVGVLAGGWGWSAAAAPGTPTLAQQMRGEVVAVVPPRTVHIRGESMAAVHHRPLDGYTAEAYPAQFGALAEALLSRAPLGWKAIAIDPGDEFYAAVETQDPDDDPATTLPSIPSEAADATYLAVFRYAELAFDIVEQPSYGLNGQLKVRRSVQLTLDLQLVIHDATDGAPLGTFDAETGVPVPELLPPALETKPFHRATAANLRKMARTVKKEG